MSGKFLPVIAFSTAIGAESIQFKQNVYALTVNNHAINLFDLGTFLQINK